MPEPNHRPPYQIADDIAGWPLWVLIDHGVTVMIECDSCHHQTAWSPEHMDRAFRSHRGKSLWWLAARLRCLNCRSQYVRLWGRSKGRLGPAWIGL